MEWPIFAWINVAALTELAPAASSVSSVGFALWFAHYTTTVAMPRQAKENREALMQKDADHREALKEKDLLHSEVVKELAAELRACRLAYERWRDRDSQLSRLAGGE